ncbi:MAG: family 20 glycosylhydrolase, partial [Verrucomicrobiota bacterium]
YPDLGCTGERIETRCHWGISQHVYNAEETTIAFLCDVLDEVVELFPSLFIHIGGDEAPKYQWAESARVQERMAELGINNEEELQSWFIRRIGEHLHNRGRRLIGWDEILEGGLAPGAAVMSWRNEEGGVTAARQGHDVVMAPSQKVYFDNYQSAPVEAEPLAIGGLVTTEDVYAYEPVPEELEQEFQHHVLGAQGQLWTEHIPDFSHLEFMAYPRACALAETLWLPQEEKNLPRFLTALKKHRERLRALGVNAHPRP